MKRHCSVCILPSTSEFCALNISRYLWVTSSLVCFLGLHCKLARLLLVCGREVFCCERKLNKRRASGMKMEQRPKHDIWTKCDQNQEQQEDGSGLNRRNKKTYEWMKSWNRYEEVWRESRTTEKILAPWRKWAKRNICFRQIRNITSW